MPVASKWIEGLAIDVRHRFRWIDRCELVAFDERAAPEEGGVTVRAAPGPARPSRSTRRTGGSSSNSSRCRSPPFDQGLRQPRRGAPRLRTGRLTFPPVDRRYNYSGPTQTLSVRFKDSVSKHVRRSKWAIEADPRNLVVPMAASLAQVNVDETLDALNKRVFVARRIIGATTIPRALAPPGRRRRSLAATAPTPWRSPSRSTWRAPS